MHRFPGALFAAVVLAAAACGTSTTSTAPASAAPPSGAPPRGAAQPSPPPSPATTAPPLPAGALAWPSQATVELEAARYFSSPPFGIPFTLDVPEDGWHSGHLHQEFFDLMRFDGVPTDGLPTRLIGFQEPLHVRGAEGNVAVAGLTPDEAVDLLAERASLTIANRQEVSLFGLDGVRIDVRSSLGNNPTFGGEAGDLGVGGELTTRMSVLQNGSGLLVAIVVAMPDDLELAWSQAGPILESVELLD